MAKILYNNRLKSWHYIYGVGDSLKKIPITVPAFWSAYVSRMTPDHLKEWLGRINPEYHLIKSNIVKLGVEGWVVTQQVGSLLCTQQIWDWSLASLNLPEVTFESRAKNNLWAQSGVAPPKTDKQKNVIESTLDKCTI